MLHFLGSASGAPLARSSALMFGAMALGILSGCGGGGGGGGGPPPPQIPFNQAPAFTSGTSVAVVENVGGTIYQAAASDAEGNPVTFSIVGGADAARFSITSAGQLSFAAPPNFDLPADSDANNVYQVELAVSDAQGRSTQTVSVTVSNSKEGVSVRRVATGFVSPETMWAVSDTLLLVGERNGAVYSFNPQTGTRQLLFQVQPIGGQGLLALAPAPDFATTGRLFVLYTDKQTMVVHEYLRNSAGQIVPKATGQVFRVPAPDYVGGGWLGFGQDGNLLIATGDAGGTGDPTGSAQDDSSLLGKIIRVTANSDPTAGPVLTRVAKGLHQPFGGFAYSGGLLFGDRGETVADEINLLATGASGINFGWAFKEGSKVVRGTPPANVVDPVFEYARVEFSGQGIVGGAIAGNYIPSISGHYVFADRNVFPDKTGLIFSVPIASLGNAQTATERRTLDFVPDVGTFNNLRAVVADPQGRLYILDNDGEIFRVDAG